MRRAIGLTFAAKMRFIGAACVAAMVLVGACRQAGPPAPLRERPETAIPAETAWLLERMKEVEQMTPEARAALESSWFRAPGDLRAAEQLLLLYAQNPGNVPAASREARLRHRQRLILWFIDQHPDHFVHRAYLTDLSSRSQRPWLIDPEGYRAATDAWRRRGERTDTSAAALGNAASFLSASDPRRAEAFLIRARRLEPEKSDWTTALASLYTSVLYPPAATMRGGEVIDADAAFVAAVRERVETSRDAGLLSAMGRSLMLRDTTAAKEYQRRALAVDPGHVEATKALASVEQLDWNRRLNTLMAKKTPGPREAALSSLSTDERLRALVYLANGDYLHAEYADWMATHPPDAEQRLPENIAKRRAESRDSWHRSKDLAQQALTLASAHPEEPSAADAIFHAHITLGLNALRDGDHAAARQHLDLASKAPPPSTSSDSSPIDELSLEDRFIKWLLKDGERETVIAYFERLAAGNEPARDRLTRAAADLRNGIQPRDYFRGKSIYAPMS